MLNTKLMDAKPPTNAEKSLNMLLALFGILMFLSGAYNMRQLKNR